MNKAKLSVRYALLSGFCLTLAACSTTSQYSSGQDYVARYESQKSEARQSQAAHVTIAPDSLESEILQIAAIEPSLVFPARIGLARIERGRLISPPSDEAQEWGDLASELGADYGEFVPVSPLVTNMVSIKSTNASPQNVVNNIRRGSARQHLDYVLVYEVTKVSDTQNNALSLANLSILGLYVLPTRNVKVDTTATAMLIDVRNGYPYGTASTFVTQKSLSTAKGRRANSDKLSDATRIEAVSKLTNEVETFIHDLRIKASEYKLAKLTSAP